MKAIWTKVFIIGLLSAAIAVGCNKEGRKQADLIENGNDTKEVVIRLWAAGDWLKGNDSPGQQTIKQFNEKYKGKIRVEGKFAPWTEHNTAIQAAFTSNGLPDLFHMPQGIELNKMVSHNMIRPLDGIVTENWYKQFYEGSFAEGVNRLDGKTYTWPLAGPQLNYILYYNKDVLASAGLNPGQPPKTWDELRQMMRSVTEKGKGDIFGFVYSGGDTGSTTRMAAGLAQGLDPLQGGQGFNLKKGQYSLNDKAWSDAIQFMLSIRADGSILPSSYYLKSTESGVLFGEGKAAFLLDARWKMWMIKRDTPNSKFGMAHVPTVDGKQPYSSYGLAPSGGTIVVSGNTRHPQEVGTFIEEALASESFYKRYMQGGVGLTPMPKINQDKANYPYPEYEQFVNIHNQVLRLSPNPSVRNPELSKVAQEIGGMQQPKVKPNLDEVLQMIMSGAEKNPDGRMKELSDKLNKGLQDGIAKAKEKGAKVSEADYSFPNWDPKKDYTESNYKQ